MSEVTGSKETLSPEVLIERFGTPHSRVMFQRQCLEQLGAASQNEEFIAFAEEQLAMRPMWTLKRASDGTSRKEQGTLMCENGLVFVMWFTSTVVESPSEMWALIEKHANGGFRSHSKLSESGVPTPDELDVMLVEAGATRDPVAGAPLLRSWGLGEVPGDGFVVFHDGVNVHVTSASGCVPATIEELEAWLEANKVEVASIDELFSQNERE